MLLLLGALACTPRAAPPEPAAQEVSLNDDATAGVTDPALRQLLHDHWEADMRRWPRWATRMGDHRYDHLLEDISPEASQAAQDEAEAMLARARALGDLNPADAVTRELLVFSLQSDVDSEVCRMDQWNVLLYSNLINSLNRLPEVHPLITPEGGDSYVARLRAMPALLDARAANLRAGLAEGRVANAETLRRMVALIDAQLALPVSEWPLAVPAADERVGWPPEREAAFREAVLIEITDGVAPALTRLRDTMEGELLPRARTGRDVGLTGVPDGAACYATQIRRYTTLSLDPDAVHQTGLEELARVHADMRALGAEVLGTDDLARIFARLREDPALRFTSAEEILETARSALSRAGAATPRILKAPPDAQCVVTEVPPLDAPYTTIAYYRPPRNDGSPGEYVVNTSAPTTRARYEAEALAFHESIPGHHLQNALSRELPDTPAFRRTLNLSAFGEGWALYSERLADELGLYTGPIDRLGMLAFDAWRAARLVVDTGIHHQGWSREDAVAFMLENTALAPTNVDNEVDRYISWPGQALSYKIGQLEVLAIRADAEAALGPAFDLPAFHDRLLGRGAVTLPMLREDVEAWVETQAP
ncbi:MAG: DUF885 domain-containing protein [Alphaproteobacteria bacterium]|nr:DUF885 domain-containing protein [Alphaproteobacteria bacterium]